MNDMVLRFAIAASYKISDSALKYALIVSAITFAAIFSANMAVGDSY